MDNICLQYSCVLLFALHFFSGADMVKNKGFLPSGPSEIPIQRNQMKEIINSLYPACKEPDIDSGVPFRADAIIANPPAYGIVSCQLHFENLVSWICAILPFKSLSCGSQL